jgi:hypothetical protein
MYVPIDQYVPFSALAWTTIKSIRHDKSGSNEALYFDTDDGAFCMTHVQDCCEDVHIEEVHGDPADVIGATISVAEESTQQGESYGSSTWTFYRLLTEKGDITIRWLGESNGYYSESVDFFRVKEIPASAAQWRP